MNKLTKEKFKQLLEIYKQAKEKIAIKMVSYNGLPVREVTLLKEVDKQIKLLEKETLDFLQTQIPFEYQESIKNAESKLENLGVKGLGVNNFTTIDKTAIEYIISDMESRVLMSVRGIRKGTVDFIAQVKQAKIREMLAVSQVAGQGVTQTAKEAGAYIKSTGITAFLDKRGRKLKLDTYIYGLIRNNIQEVHNTAAYNRYIEAGITIAQYSYIGDKKVSNICRPREGKYFYLDGITPPPLGSHYNCRHTLEPAVIVPKGVKIHLTYPN